MKYDESSSFYRLLATRYDEDKEDRALDILEGAPLLAQLEWPGPDDQGQPFVRGSTALHYAANDGKVRLCRRLIEFGADVNASNANWYRSVLSWAANNARNEAITLLLAHGADPRSLDAVHAAAWGGSGCGEGEEAASEQLRQLFYTDCRTIVPNCSAAREHAASGRNLLLFSFRKTRLEPIT